MSPVSVAARPEIIRDPVAANALGVAEKPLSAWERATNVGLLRKLVLLAVLALIW